MRFPFSNLLFTEFFPWGRWWRRRGVHSFRPQNYVELVLQPRQDFRGFGLEAAQQSGVAENVCVLVGESLLAGEDLGGFVPGQVVAEAFIEIIALDLGADLKIEDFQVKGSPGFLGPP